MSCAKKMEKLVWSMPCCTTTNEAKTEYCDKYWNEGVRDSSCYTELETLCCESKIAEIGDEEVSKKVKESRVCLL